MNPGICYLYEYKNDQKLRNVGFMKVTPHYHSCILQINARGIPVKNGESVSLLAFYENGSESIAKPIQTITCGEKTIYARLSLTDSEYPGGKILEDLSGFLLKTEDGQYYAAFSDNLPFDTRKVRIWKETPKDPVQTETYEAEPGIETKPNAEAEPGAKTEPKAGAETRLEAESSKEVPPVMNEPPLVMNEESIPETEASLEISPVMEAESVEVFPCILEEPDKLEKTQDLEEITENVGELSMEETEALDKTGEPDASARSAVPEPMLTDSVRMSNDSVHISTDSEPLSAEPVRMSADSEPLSAEPVHMSADSGAGQDEHGETQRPSETVRKIQRSELSVLPRKSWNLANNSFLMHGYHNYNHLLLVEEDGHFWLGVPGVYAPREARAAELFGFPQFTQSYISRLKLEEDERDENERFGYWCRYIH